MLHNAHYSGNWANNNWGMAGHDGSMMSGGVHGLFGVLFMTLLVIAIVVLIRWLWRAGHTQSSSQPGALHVLEERYAKGEIDQAEFLAKKKDLG
jgi:putative membrane protein